ncbi:Blc [Desulforapulum autotrophicum HRM2]|uniref:Outer membrane lipoprotein Blc n=1 Tax=Desulforapulum autotrophicum (strain ATCC 43914 / DSM 3382 / VKM B-1955 / HRM2) TaxID=177437 RepID=C0QID7_DESAH|nr:lipocalin family protein [Desulforapulum autotrophicum]ACN17881.1 Blc [Desulforapulum autotrophicum HRM2]
MKKLSILFLLFLLGCAGIPENITPVGNFKIERYLGRWYEIARLDHSFERGLTQVTADYTFRDDGGVSVLNRGFSVELDSWKEAEGKAYFVKGADQGYLKVSFWGPFYGSYIVFELDHENYQYSLVCGPSKSYLWVLARSPIIPERIKSTLLEQAAASGFDINKLIFVDHTESLDSNSAGARIPAADSQQ